MAGFYYATIRPALTPATPALNKRLTEEYRPLEVEPPPLPEPKIEMPNVPLPLPSAVSGSFAKRDDRQPLKLEVPIQDGATIDFSIGAPVVRSQGDDKAALEKALKEMADATKDVQFPASTPEKK